MKFLIYKNNSGYSIIIVLIIIGFLLVLTTGIFNLLLKELKDNKAMGNYINAYAGAESAQELALLKIKENGYGYYDKIEHNINNRSIILSLFPLDISKFNPARDIMISYDIGSMVTSYEGKLNPLEHDIIPLFYVNDLGEQKTTRIKFEILEGVGQELAWNVIGKEIGLSGNNSDTLGVKKRLDTDGFTYGQEDINTFLSSSDTNYFHLFNTGNSGIIKYRVSVLNNSEAFSKPETEIISSAQVGNYKQNLSTKLDNTEFLNVLKYSIFSN